MRLSENLSDVAEDCSNAQPVLVGFKPCGCCVAVDLDSHPDTMLEYKRKGYISRMMPKKDAMALLKTSLCFHK